MDILINPRLSQTTHNPRDVLVQVHDYLGGQGFFYTRQTVANYYVSLKTKPFVILAGPSGTGKSQLPRLFAAALGHADRCLTIPVRPDWTDPGDILAYPDLQGRYRRQALLRWILQAKADPENPYWVVLDEMNLAKVEYYLSDVLSIIETRRWEDGLILTDPLLGPLDVTALHPEDHDLVGLTWPQNLYLVGTINVDESTQSLSKRVLDRSNVIEINEVRLDWPEETAPIEPLSSVFQDFTTSEFLSSHDLGKAEKAILKTPMRWLGQVHTLMSKYDLPLGYRLRDEFAFYLLYRERIKELVAEGEALDRQFLQKILPKVYGVSPRLGKLLKEMMALLAPQAMKDLDLELIGLEDLEVRLKDPFRRKLPFPRSLEKLLLMYRRFEEEGFVSYWL
ncbi:MAG: AAA family ATPase [Bacteroidota bacterium]